VRTQDAIVLLAPTKHGNINSGLFDLQLTFIER